jgi:hypothetical protein
MGNGIGQSQKFKDDCYEQLQMTATVMFSPFLLNFLEWNELLLLGPQLKTSLPGKSQLFDPHSSDIAGPPTLVSTVKPPRHDFSAS